jgi:hypothetical protein
MEDTVEVYTAMISARTGKCSVVTTGQGRFGTTIRTGQSKFVKSLCTILEKLLTRAPAATGPWVLTHKAFGLVLEAVLRRSTAWLLLIPAHKMLP